MDTAGRAVAFFGLGGDRGPLVEAIKKKGGTGKNIRLVHALVKGQLSLAGKRFVHAWVEVGNTAFDFSNGNSAVMDKNKYYGFAGVNPNEKGAFVKYTQDKTMDKISSTHHWGPWDVDLSKEILEGIRVTRLMALDEAKIVIPKTKSQIGKHKVRLTKGDIEALTGHE